MAGLYDDSQQIPCVKVRRDDGSLPADEQRLLLCEHEVRNSYRGRLSRHLPGGLIIAGSSAFKAGTAAAAPDLWSIRALVLEPEKLALELGEIDIASIAEGLPILAARHQARMLNLRRIRNLPCNKRSGCMNSEM